MKSRYLSKAKQAIRTRRTEADAKLAEKLQTLRKTSPEYCNAESKLNSLYFEKARLESQNADFSYLNKQIKQAEQELNSVLKKLGLTHNDLVAGYVCTTCQDTGQVAGKLCACVKKEISKLIAGVQDGRITKKSSFATDFSFFGKSAKEYERNYALIKKIASSYPNINTKVAVFCGKSGTGKSYLASILANVLEQNLYDTIFIKAVRLNKLFLEYHLAPLEEKSGILSSLFNCQALIIDDLGSENFLNNVTSEYLYQLIVERQQQFTLITTNLNPDEINEIYGSRVFSRLADKGRSLWLRFNSEDLRLK